MTPAFKIVADGNGASLLNMDGHITWCVPWHDVTGIVAWKEDQFTVDLLCVGLRTAESPDFYRCTEDEEGWDDLLDALRRRFNLNFEERWAAVMFPAFEENFTTLWSR